MTTPKSGQPSYHCSFCGKAQGQVERLIAGTDRVVFICDECVVLCGQILTDDRPTVSRDASGMKAKGVSPKWLYDKLNEYVVGQDRAKKVLSVAVYNHYKRVWSNQKTTDVELHKSNILLTGPAGSGKTLLAETLAKVLDVPFAIADATSLTEAGYVGEDVENILLRLIQAADFDVSRAEQGVIYIDEIDKVARKSPNPSITRDVSGEGVQQALLKIIEGCVASVPPQGGRKHPHQDFLQIKTDNILFMCGGAFEGLADIVEWRVTKDRTKIGFSSPNLLENGEDEEYDILEHLTADDLLKYGFIPELVGRLPVTVSLAKLNRDALVSVLTEPKDALVKQYQALFRMDDVELEFTNEALRAVADEALKLETGARGLRAILEQTLLDVMYEIPSLKEITRCTVDEDSILDGAPVSLETADAELFQLPSPEQKSA